MLLEDPVNDAVEFVALAALASSSAFCFSPNEFFNTVEIYAMAMEISDIPTLFIKRNVIGIPKSLN